MKGLILLSFLLFFPMIGMAEMGSFLVTKSVYLHKEANKTSKRILTRRKQAYPVVALQKGGKDQLWLQIEVPSGNNRIQGVGYIVQSDSDLEAKGEGPVKVFRQVPTAKEGLTDYIWVAPIDLLVTGQEQKSSHFPSLPFRAVKYKSNQPRKYWVADWAGVYRPDKDAEWLNRVSQKLSRRKLKKEVAIKILNGLVDPGFGMEEVRMALGEPLKTMALPEKKQTEWTYPDRKIIFEDGRVIRQM